MSIPSYVRRPRRGAQERRPAGTRERDTCGVNVVHLHAVEAARDALPDPSGLARVAELLSLLSNPTRLKILMALQPKATVPHGELCVCDLAMVIGASKSLTSHQLRLLRTAGLVALRRSGKLVYYRLLSGTPMHLLSAALELSRGTPNQ